MSAFDAGSVIGHLGLDTTQFKRGFEEAHTHAESEGGRIREILESIGEVLTEALGPAFAQFGQELQSAFAGFSEGPIIGSLNLIGLALGAVREATEATAGRFEQMELAAQRAGVGVEWMSKVTAAASAVGVGVDQISMGFKILEQRAGLAAEGNKQAAEGFARLGISVADVVRMTPDQLFDRTRESLGKMTSATERAAAANGVLGREGNLLVPLFAMSQERYDHLTESAMKFGATTTEQDAEMSQSVANLEADFRFAMQGIENAAARPILQYIQAHMKELEDEAVKLAAAIRHGIEITEETAEKLYPYLHSLGEWIEKNGDLVITLGSAAAGMATVGAAVTSLGIAVKAITGVFSLASSGLSSIGIAAAGATGPLMALGAAVGFLAAAEIRAQATGESLNESIYKLLRNTDLHDLLTDAKVALDDVSRLTDEVNRHLARAHDSKDSRDEVEEIDKATAALERKRDVLQDLLDQETKTNQSPTIFSSAQVRSQLSETGELLTKLRDKSDGLQKEQIAKAVMPGTEAGEVFDQPIETPEIPRETSRHKHSAHQTRSRREPPIDDAPDAGAADVAADFSTAEESPAYLRGDSVAEAARRENERRRQSLVPPTESSVVAPTAVPPAVSPPVAPPTGTVPLPVPPAEPTPPGPGEAQPPSIDSFMQWFGPPAKEHTAATVAPTPPPTSPTTSTVQPATPSSSRHYDDIVRSTMVDQAASKGADSAGNFQADLNGMGGTLSAEAVQRMRQKALDDERAKKDPHEIGSDPQHRLQHHQDLLSRTLITQSKTDDQGNFVIGGDTNGLEGTKLTKEQFDNYQAAYNQRYGDVSGHYSRADTDTVIDKSPSGVRVRDKTAAEMKAERAHHDEVLQKQMAWEAFHGAGENQSAHSTASSLASPSEISMVVSHTAREHVGPGDNGTGRTPAREVQQSEQRSSPSSPLLPLPAVSTATASSGDNFNQQISGLFAGLKDSLRDSYREALAPVVAGVTALVGAVSRQAVNPQFASGASSSSFSSRSPGGPSQSPTINQPLTVNLIYDPREVASQVARRIEPVLREAKTHLEDQIANQSHRLLAQQALGGAGGGGND